MALIRVRAKQNGQYKGRMYEHGEEFVIDDAPIQHFKCDDNGRPLKDDKGNRVVEHTRSPVEYWMELVKEEKKI